MKKIGFLLLLCFSFTMVVQASHGPRPRKSSSSGHYAGGSGRSHKGGSYKNASTHDHYRKRK